MFVFEEKLAPGDMPVRHSQSQREVIQRDCARLRQWSDGKPALEVETVPDRPRYSAPVIRVVKTIGGSPLRGVIIEFRPGRPGPGQR